MRHPLLRVAALAGALVVTAALLKPLGMWDSWPIAAGLGGAIGMLVYNGVASIVTAWAAIPLFLVASLAFIGLASGLRAQEWLGLAATVGLGVRFALRMVGKLVQLIRSGEMEEDAEEDVVAKAKRSRVRQKKEPTPKLHVKKVATKRQVELQEEEEAKKPRATQTSFDLGEYGDYELPSTNLLTKTPAKSKKKRVSESSLSQNAELLEQTLLDFGVKGEIIRVRPGPVVTLYELEPAAGVKSSRVIGLADDIARSMSATSARIAVIPGKNALGIELPNSNRETVYIRLR